MRFIHGSSFGGRVTGPYTAEEAVAKQVEQEAACDGQIERLNAKIESLQGIIGRLIEAMPVRSKRDAEELARVIGYAWEAEEEQ